MATKAELLEGINPAELPATAVPGERMTSEPLAEVEPGDTVVVFSRDRNRLARVLTVTAKRVMVAYTTVGAWKTAQGIWEHYMTMSPEAAAEAAARAEGKNYDFYVRESSAETAEFAKASDIRTEEQAVAERAKYVALIEGVTREEYQARAAEEARAGALRLKAEAKAGGVARYLTVTTKPVKRDEVFGLKAAV